MKIPNRINKRLGVFLYFNVAMHLPGSFTRFGKTWRRFRAYAARKFIEHVGENINIENNAMITSMTYIGNNSGIGKNSVLHGKVTIGDNVMMGPECIIYTQNHAFSDLSIPMIKQGFSPMRPVTIGNDVWIGGRVIILPGVTIADGCVIGAGAVVTKSTERNGIYGGNPCKRIKDR